MFRTLLTPLVARFPGSLSPSLPTVGLSPSSPNGLRPDADTSGDMAPEDFAREVMIELMRNAVDSLKEAATLDAKTDALAEMHKIMLQDARTKEVFRELDGFIMLLSLLSGLSAGDTHVGQVTECIRLVFLIMSAATHEHTENAQYLKDNVGFDSLSTAVRDLVTNPSIVDATLGYLLSMALHDFAAQVSGLFIALREVQVDHGHDRIDLKMQELKIDSRTIAHPDAIHLLWDCAPHLGTSMRYSVYKLFELLCASCHRNQAMLSSMGIVQSLLTQYLELRATKGGAKQIAQRLLRRLLELGASPEEARRLFERTIRAEDQSLDMEMLEIVRAAMKSRWLEHLSLESPAELSMLHTGARGVPSTGFTFAMWLWVENLPKVMSHPIFTVRVSNTDVVALSVRPDGKLELRTSGNKAVASFSKATIPKMRWCHVTLVHYPHRASQPSIRLFVDGVLNDSLTWVYPKSLFSATAAEYVLGSAAEEAHMSWCIGTAYLLSLPISDDIPRLIHHLGPRYQGNFQDPSLIKFLTYEASTSLNMFLTTIASKGAPVESLPLMKAVRDGAGISSSAVVFSLSCRELKTSGAVEVVPMASRSGREFEVRGDVIVVKATCLDTSLWKIGGTAIPLRLLQLAKTPHEISRTLSILTDSIRNSWENSEDMERLKGYEILTDILRTKAQMINMTSFETLFEAFGLNFRTPEQSTITNVVAYKAIALDFEFWSKTRPEIQRVYFEHFGTLMEASRYTAFNIKQRLAKLGLVRKMLFVLQTEWFGSEAAMEEEGDDTEYDGTGYVIEALRVAMKANFKKDDTIKPIVSYVAANLGSSSTVPPASPASQINFRNAAEKAERVLEVFVTVLSTPAYYNKFITALPVTRICLLLLAGEQGTATSSLGPTEQSRSTPSPFVAKQVLRIIAISIRISASFARKFELISGWSVLKTVLPGCWDVGVGEAAFDVLLGRAREGDVKEGNGKGKGKEVKGIGEGGTAIVCPQIVPTIFAALQTGLRTVGKVCSVEDDQNNVQPIESMERLVEQLIELHTLSPSFRQVFRSQQTTRVFIEAYRAFVTTLIRAPSVNQRTLRLLEKIEHLGISLVVDDAVAGAQKREIQQVMHDAETLLNPSSGTEKTVISEELMGDHRTVRDRFASARFSIQVSERTVVKIVTRMQEWRKTIQVSETKRLRKNLLDLREHRRQIGRLYEWSYALTSERGVWPDGDEKLWRLDETEGPHRIRNKLEPESQRPLPDRLDASASHVRDVSVPETDNSSALHVEVPPWSESYEISATEVEERQLAEDIKEDKHRRVRHELEPGDVIEAIGTVARISGVDSSPGLLIIGKTHLYMLDGLVEDDKGEVIDAHDAPKRLLFVPGSIVELDGPQKAQRWSHLQIETYSQKTFLFRDVALEIYFKDSRSLLIVFLDQKKRLDLGHRLSMIINNASGTSAQKQATPGLMRTPLLAMVLSGFRADELATAQRKWQAREISNFTYLSILNQISGRTPSDATQYPVFPWVIQDYNSEVLDLNNPATFRDLTKPMGALTSSREAAARDRYESLESVDERPFHYGTHFSSSMIVCHFLIRMSPFTSMFKTLQGGNWDLPDRLFSNIARAYDSAAKDVRGDVRELIPEFYTCPEFLENSRNLDFGVQQSSGEKIHHVKLPPWAKGDPLLFITLNRKALESSYASEHLADWIDLIWGYKQRDVNALNCFHPLSYEGSIDLDSITDELEKEATVGIIHNFGQTPRKLFDTPHPQRFNHGCHSLPLGTLHGIPEDAHLLIQGSRCFKDLGPTVPVRELVFDMIGEKIVPCPAGMLCTPSRPHEQIEWGAGELRALVDSKVVQVIEGTSSQCATFADANCLVTGSGDFTVRIWRVSRNVGGAALHLSAAHMLRIHHGPVIAVVASRAWSVIVSGSEDGSAALWDLNRGIYLRSIWHRDQRDEPVPVNIVAINECTGYVATCSSLKLDLHTVNGRHIALLDVTRLPSLITSLAFHEREYSEIGVLATGHADGTVVLRTWNAEGTSPDEPARWDFVTLRSFKIRAIGRAPPVTALKFLGENMCHGEEAGKAFMWSLPD